MNSSQKPEDALNTSRSHLGLMRSRLDSSVGDSEGTRGIRIGSLSRFTDRPVILEDVKLSQPANLSGHKAWRDVEDSCFVDEDLHPLPLLE